MLLQGGKNSLSSSSDSKIIVKETFKEAGMENLYLQLYMNILLMVLATARDKIRLAKSVGRRSNCCWDSSGSFNREGHKQMSHVPCGFWHILVSLNLYLPLTSGMMEMTGKNSGRDVISYSTRESSSVLPPSFSMALLFPGIYKTYTQWTKQTKAQSKSYKSCNTMYEVI